MKRASITEAKNALSALLDRVRHGERVIIEDRGVPIARLEPVLDLPAADEGRVARLERAGVARRALAAPPRSVLKSAPPRPARGTRLSHVVLDERRNDR